MTKFPYGFTIPAGHVDNQETAHNAARREAEEETGINVGDPQLLAQTMIHGDSCRRGSDDHQWSLYIAFINQEASRQLQLDQHEGKNARWIKPESVLDLDLPPAMRYLFGNFNEKILHSIQGHNTIHGTQERK